MKNITVNLNVKNLPSNTLPQGVIGCPRVWIVKGRLIGDGISVNSQNIQEAKYFQVGEFIEEVELNDDQGIKVEAYCWQHQEILFLSETFVMTRVAGENKDQVWKSAFIKDAGIYNITIDIK